MVTIILLLILAGISISLISGSEGILGRSTGAVDQNDEATATEKIEMKITYFNITSYGENTRKANLQELAEGMFRDKEIEYVKIKEQKVASLETIDVTGESSIFVKLKEYPYEFEINENLHLASVDGVKVENSDSEQIEELKNQVATLEEENENLKAQIEELKNKKGTVKKIYLGQFNSTVANKVNVSAYEDYQNFTIENFVIGNAKIFNIRQIILDNKFDWILNSANYNSSTGILTTTTSADANGNWNMYIIFDLYLIDGEIKS